LSLTDPNSVIFAEVFRGYAPKEVVTTLAGTVMGACGSQDLS
jgi:hypothetical protein